MLVARVSLTLSRHSSLSFIALGRSSGQHPVSSHSCWMYVRAGRPAFARPCVGVHKSTSLMSSSLLLQQCPACLVRLTWIVFVIGGMWPYSWCLVGCCRQDLFKIASSILGIFIYILFLYCGGQINIPVPANFWNISDWQRTRQEWQNEGTASKGQTSLWRFVNRKSVRRTVATAGWWSLEHDLVAGAGLDSWYQTGSCSIGGR